MLTLPAEPKPEERPRGLQEKRAVRFGLRRYSAAEFLCALALLIVVSPFVEDLKIGSIVESILFSLVFMSGVLAIGGRRATLIVAVILVCPVLFAKWVNHLWPNLVPQEFFFATGLAFSVFLIVQLLMFILRAKHVNSEVVCAGLSIYLMLGMSWMFAYLILARVNPDAFAFTVVQPGKAGMDNFSGYYFSFITLTTVGYGDIVPISRVARMLATTEAMTGTLFVAVLISRLVALYSSQPPGERSGD